MKYALLAMALLAFAPAARADAQAEAQKVNEAFIAAVNIKDPAKSVPTVLAHFTEDAQHIGVFGRVHGKKEFQQILPKAFADPNRQGKLNAVEGLQLDANTILSISHFDNIVTGPEGK